MTKIRLGTRKSNLAMWQTQHVAQLLCQLDSSIEVEVVPIITLGDRITDRPLHELGGTAVFTKEIEAALLDDKCDIAVHSLKDLATMLPSGLCIAAYLKREDPRDVFVSRNNIPLESLLPGATIGTSSLRRGAMLARLRPDISIVSLRGNVPTRLGAAGRNAADAKPYHGPALDGTILAAAGVLRLGFGSEITEFLPLESMLPAPGQGVIALQTRQDNESAVHICRQLECTDTRMAAVAERTFLQTVEGGCRLPIGAYATVANGQITLRGIVLAIDGTTTVEGVESGGDPFTVGQRLAHQILAGGGQKILDDVLLKMNASPQRVSP